MSLRISADEALKRRLIDEDTAKQIKSGTNNRLANLRSDRHSSQISKSNTAGDVYAENSPQRILYNALCQRLPGLPKWEVKGLIPGRRIRVDIFIPPRVIVEMDGFRFHKSLEAFKNDRKRQNLLTANGFLVFRTFAKEVLDEGERHALVELIAETAEKNFQCGEIQ